MQTGTAYSKIIAIMIHLIESKSSAEKGSSAAKAALVVKTKILRNKFTLTRSSEDID